MRASQANDKAINNQTEFVGEKATLGEKKI